MIPPNNSKDNAYNNALVTSPPNPLADSIYPITPSDLSQDITDVCDIACGVLEPRDDKVVWHTADIMSDLPDGWMLDLMANISFYFLAPLNIISATVIFANNNSSLSATIYSATAVLCVASGVYSRRLAKNNADQDSGQEYQDEYFQSNHLDSGQNIE